MIRTALIRLLDRELSDIVGARRDELAAQIVTLVETMQQSKRKRRSRK